MPTKVYVQTFKHKEARVQKLKETLKKNIVYIPMLCACGCGETVWFGWNGQCKYKLYHHQKTFGKTFGRTNLSKKFTVEHKIKLSIAKENLYLGDKNPNWHGGTSFLPYCEKFNKKLKQAVKERDEYTCQLCGATNKKLAVHHVHYDKENCYPDLITLCCSDNSRVNNNRKHYEHLFMNKLNDRGLLFWTLSLYKEKTDNDERTEV